VTGAADSTAESLLHRRRQQLRCGFTPASIGRCLVLSHPRAEGAPRVLGIDLDGCLIKPTGLANGKPKQFCEAADDWTLWHPGAWTQLAALRAQHGFRVVVFTNQRGATGGAGARTSLSTVIARCERVIQAAWDAAQLPLQVFVAPEDDFYRKPRVGMWLLFACLFNGGVQVDMDASAFVGDAAGRAGRRSLGKVTGKDHSDGDLCFALNLGLGFATPEAFFRGPKGGLLPEDIRPYRACVLPPGRRFVPWRDLPLPSSSPPPLPSASSSGDTPVSSSAAPQELVLLIAPPAAGKSTVCALHFPAPRYCRINQDILGKKEKAMEAAAAVLRRGSSVVVDATNLVQAVRLEWLQLARQASASLPAGAPPIRTVAVPLSLPRIGKRPSDTLLHLNELRAVNPLEASGDPNPHRRVPEHVIIGMTEPIAHTPESTMDEGLRCEGFDSVRRLPLSLGPFDEANPADAFLQQLTYSFLRPEKPPAAAK
jgi:DNA 3'-phosphatase